MDLIRKIKLKWLLKRSSRILTWSNLVQQLEIQTPTQAQELTVALYEACQKGKCQSFFLGKCPDCNRVLAGGWMTLADEEGFFVGNDKASALDYECLFCGCQINDTSSKQLVCEDAFLPQAYRGYITNYTLIENSQKQRYQLETLTFKQIVALHDDLVKEDIIAWEQSGHYHSLLQFLAAFCVVTEYDQSYQIYLAWLLSCQACRAVVAVGSFDYRYDFEKMGGDLFIQGRPHVGGHNLVALNLTCPCCGQANRVDQVQIVVANQDLL